MGLALIASLASKFDWLYQLDCAYNEKYLVNAQYDFDLALPIKSNNISSAIHMCSKMFT